MPSTLAVSHPELKVSGPCPEPLCRSNLYDTHAANKDVAAEGSAADREATV